MKVPFEDQQDRIGASGFEGWKWGWGREWGAVCVDEEATGRARSKGVSLEGG